MKTITEIREEILEYIQKNERLRYSEIKINENGFFVYCDEYCLMMPLSPILDNERINEILTWNRIEIKMRSDL